LLAEYRLNGLAPACGVEMIEEPMSAKTTAQG